MNKIVGVVLAAAVASASVCAHATELTDQDRAELRQRAQELQNQRARDPDFQPGQGRLASSPAAETPKAPKRAAKARTNAKDKETGRQKASRKARNLKNIPGAMLRK